MVDVSSLTSGADQTYFEGLISGEIRLQFCAGCGTSHWPAVFRCADCGSWQHEWKSVAPLGTIYSWTRTWHSFSGTDGFGIPYVSLVVSLNEVPSVRLLGVLNSVDAAPKIGLQVRAETTKVEFQNRSIPALSWSLV